MIFGMKSSTKLLMTLASAATAAIGTGAGASLWQAFGKPKIEAMAEKNKQPKREIGFNKEWGC